MRIRLATAVAVAGIAVAALPGHAATAPKPQITDPAGDANGINDQLGGVFSVPSTSTPADLSGADITSVLFTSTFKTKLVNGKRVKVPSGFTVSMALAEAPMSNVIFRVAANTASCGTSVFFEYAGGGDSTVRCPSTSTTGEDTVYKAAPAKVKGTTITWTLPISSFPAGTSFTDLNAQTRQYTPVPTGGFVSAPQWDFATSTATYSVGK